jgi:Alpha/beta hydrolase domain
VDGSNAFVPVLDADGNWEGGLRLPHVSSTVLGRRSGAPLGRYDPLNDVKLDPFNPFALISGTFTRFSDAEILARYPTRQTYVHGVVLAAVSLAQRHYVSDADAAAIILAARNEPLSEALRRDREAP